MTFGRLGRYPGGLTFWNVKDLYKKHPKLGGPRRHTRIYLRGEWWWIYYRHKGRTVQESLKTVDQGEAELFQRRIEVALLENRLDFMPRISTTEYVDRFMGWLETNNRRPKTLIQYDWALRRFFEIAAWEYLDEFSAADAERFKAAMLAEGLRPPSINSVLGQVKSFFERAELDGFIEKNPYRRVPMLKVERRNPKFLTRSQVERLLDYFKDHRPYDLVACLGALCGFRSGEAAAALWEWFDFERQTVTITSRDGFQIKDWAARTVPLSSWALSILGPQRKSEGYVILFPGRKRTGPVASFKRAWPKLVEAAGLPGVTVKQLRSTFGSLHLQQGVSLSKIALWMGHSSEDVTRRHYAALMAYDDDIERLKQ